MANRDELPRFLMVPARQAVAEFLALNTRHGLNSALAWDADDPQSLGNKDARWEAALTQAANEKGLGYDKQQRRIFMYAGVKSA